MKEFLSRKVTFDVSYVTFVKIIAIALLLVILYLLRELILIILVAVVLASGLDSWIDSLQKKRIPRWLSALFILVFLAAVFVGVVYLLVPPIISQTQQLIQVLPDYFKLLLERLGKTNLVSPESAMQGLKEIINNVGSKFSATIFGTFSSLIKGIFSVLLVFVLTFYFTVEENRVKKLIKFLVPADHKGYVDDLVSRIQLQIGKWFRGQLLLCAIIGVMTFVVLQFMGVQYALVLAILAGILEIVPYIGPIAGAIPAVFLAFTQSPLLGILVIIAFVLIQQLENHLIVPNVMKRVVGLDPLIIILAILIFGKIAGIWGMLLAVPVATALHIFLIDVMQEKNKDKAAAIRAETYKIEPHQIGMTAEEIKRQQTAENDKEI